MEPLSIVILKGAVVCAINYFGIAAIFRYM